VYNNLFLSYSGQGEAYYLVLMGYFFRMEVLKLDLLENLESLNLICFFIWNVHIARHSCFCKISRNKVGVLESAPWENFCVPLTLGFNFSLAHFMIFAFF
jgi:hypothetical protein